MDRSGCCLDSLPQLHSVPYMTVWGRREGKGSSDCVVVLPAAHIKNKTVAACAAKAHEARTSGCVPGTDGVQTSKVQAMDRAGVVAGSKSKGQHNAAIPGYDRLLQWQKPSFRAAM